MPTPRWMDQANSEDFSWSEALGGTRGVIEATAPGLVFVIVFVATRALVPTLVAASCVFGAPQGSAANVYTGAPVAAGQPVQQQAAQQGYVQPAYATTPQQSVQQAPVGINPVTGQPY